MGKIIRLTESDLVRLVKRVINEQNNYNYKTHCGDSMCNKKANELYNKFVKTNINKIKELVSIIGGGARADEVGEGVGFTGIDLGELKTKNGYLGARIPYDILKDNSKKLSFEIKLENNPINLSKLVNSYGYKKYNDYGKYYQIPIDDDKLLDFVKNVKKLLNS
jgi:hypothetical protein